MPNVYLTLYDGSETILRSDVPDETTAQEMEYIAQEAYNKGRSDECTLLTNMINVRAHHRDDILTHKPPRKI